MKLKLLIIFLFVICFCSELHSFTDLNLNMYGEIGVLFKSQNSYYTPLDNPIWLNDWKSGASHRKDQNFRSAGEIGLYFGQPGDKFFGLAQFYFDANNPDLEIGEKNGAEFDPQYVFINYRPFQIYGGRPLGITIGKHPVKATGNAAYSYVFLGDFDYDFIAYSTNFLSSSGAVTIDFHISKDTGIGFTFSNTPPIISSIFYAVNDDYSKTKVFWGEFKKGNFSFNSAYQIVDGEQYATQKEQTNNGNEYYTFKNNHRHKLFNCLLSYDFKINNLNVKPWMGFQSNYGFEANLPYLEAEGYGDRYTDAQTLSAGLIYNKNKITFAFEFSKLFTAKFNGIDTLPYGFVNELIKPIYTFMPKNEELTNYNWSNSVIAGYSSSVYYASDMDLTMHLELVYKISDKIKIGSFFYLLKSKGDDTIGNENLVRQQLLDRISDKLENEAGIDTVISDETSQQILTLIDTIKIDMDGQNETIFNQIMYACKVPEWEDSHSFGIFCYYSF